MSEVSKENTLFQEVYQKVAHTIKTKSISVTDIVLIGTNAMSIVQSYKELSGGEKKTLVLEILEHMINESGLLPEEYKDEANSILKNVVPQAIDVIKSVVNGDIDFGKIIDDVKGCLPCGKSGRRR